MAFQRKIYFSDKFDTIQTIHINTALGDTPLDIDCAHFNNLKCVAVATGKFSSSELKDYSPELLLEDFSDTEKVVEQLKNL